jgi:hypothetical protein
MHNHTATRAGGVPALGAFVRTIRAWRYAGGKRDLRFDLLRGFAVVAMVTDHTGGDRSFLYLLTGGDRFFVSAAEAFVFLSGLLMGMVNGGLIRRGKVDGALTKVLRRAGMLYGLTVGLTLLTGALPLALRLPGRPDLAGRSFLEYLIGIFTLHTSITFVDVLMLYTILVLIAEPVLLLLDQGYTRLVLGISWALWFVWQCWPQQATIGPVDGQTLFPIASWQVLFMTALVIGFHRRALERYFRAAASPQALLIAGAVLCGALALFAARLAPLTWLTRTGDPAIVTEWFFAKRDVGAGRLVTFAALIVCAYALTTLCWQPIERTVGRFLLPLGQSALSAYVVHIFVAYLLHTIRPALLGPQPAIWGHTLVQIAGIALVWAAVRVRPVLAASLERLDSGWAIIPAPIGLDAALLLEQQSASLDVRVAQAEAHRGMELLR